MWKKFKITILNDNYPNQDNEVIHCPYCYKAVGYIRTSGIVESDKIY